MLTIKPKTRKEIYLAYLSGDMSLELPEPLTRDEVNLYNLCKNKAYGEYTTVKEVLAEQKAENLEYMDGLGYLVPQSIGLVVGGKYIVTYNGVDYECTGIDGSVANATGNVFLGDISLVTPGQEEIYDEPFMLVDMPEDGVTGIVPTAAQVAFESISIRQEVTEVKKISGKYAEGMGYAENDALFAEQEVPLEGSFYDIPGVGLVAGEEYIVHYGGAKYTCVAKEGIMDGDSIVGLGNLRLFDRDNTDTGEPFGYFEFGGWGSFVPDLEDWPDTIVFSISKETIHPIDQKFIVLTSPNGTKYGLSVADDGTLSASPLEAIAGPK